MPISHLQVRFFLVNALYFFIKHQSFKWHFYHFSLWWCQKRVSCRLSGMWEDSLKLYPLTWGTRREWLRNMGCETRRSKIGWMTSGVATSAPPPTTNIVARLDFQTMCHSQTTQRVTRRQLTCSPSVNGYWWHSYVSGSGTHFSLYSPSLCLYGMRVLFYVRQMQTVLRGYTIHGLGRKTWSISHKHSSSHFQFYHLNRFDRFINYLFDYLSQR